MKKLLFSIKMTTAFLLICLMLFTQNSFAQILSTDNADMQSKANWAFSKTKNIESNNVIGRAGVTRPTLEINMYSINATGNNILVDGVLQNFDNAYSAGIDNFDVRKIMNIYDNIAIKNGNYNLIVERRPNLVVTDTIKLSITGMRVSSYSLEIDPSVLANLTMNAFLIDKYLQTETPVSFIDVTNYSFNITTDVASKAWDRFMIVFKAIPSLYFTTISATRNSNTTISVTWGTQAERNVLSYELEQSNDGTNFTTLLTQMPTANNGGNANYNRLDANASKKANWYRVKALGTNNIVKYSSIAMVNAVEVEKKVEGNISIFPNPINDGMVNIHFTNKKIGKYNVKIVNNIGQTIKSENLQLQNATSTSILKVNNSAKGNFQLILTDIENNKTIIPFILN
ncbi:MAG: hypothetical protein HOO89_01180 [Ferruginibacter sp.]|nr:hypothetical protein [Ferruginibacter sp.]